MNTIGSKAILEENCTYSVRTHIFGIFDSAPVEEKTKLPLGESHWFRCFAHEIEDVERRMMHNAVCSESLELPSTFRPTADPTVVCNLGRE